MSAREQAVWTPRPSPEPPPRPPVSHFTRETLQWERLRLLCLAEGVPIPGLPRPSSACVPWPLGRGQGGVLPLSSKLPLLSLVQSKLARALDAETQAGGPGARTTL